MTLLSKIKAMVITVKPTPAAPNSFAPLQPGGADCSDEGILWAQIGEVSRLGMAQALDNARSNVAIHGVRKDDPCEDALPWLQGLVDNGTFDLDLLLNPTSPEPALGNILSPAPPLPPGYENVERVRALMEFTEGGTYPPDPEAGITVVQIVPAPGFSELITGAARRMAEQARKQVDRGESFSPHQVAMLALMMVGASALDLAQEVGALARACPQAMTEPLSMGNTRSNAPWLAKDVQRIHFTPYYAAMQFSSTACMEAMAQAGLAGNAPMIYINGPKDHLGIAQNARNTAGARDVAGCLLYCSPFCSRDALALALARRNEAFAGQSLTPGSKTDKADMDKALGRSVLECVVKGTHWENDRRNTFIDSGLFDSDTSLAVSQAIKLGVPELIHHCAGRIDWVDLTARYGPLSQLISRTSTTHGGKGQEACLALIAQASRDGCDGIFNTYISDSLLYSKKPPKRTQPIEMLLDSGYDRVLLAYLEAGFDPDKNYHDLPSAMDVAKTIDSRKSVQMQHMMRTFQTRKQAMSAISEIDGLAPWGPSSTTTTKTGSAP